MAISVTPRLIMKAARRRNWRVEIIDEKYAFYSLETPSGEKYYLRNITSKKSSAVNTIIANNKDILARVADEIGIKMPASLLWSGNWAEALEFLEKNKKIVVKPTDQGHGDGVEINITTPAKLKTAIARAKKFSSSIMLQQQIDGDDYRLLFIGGQLAAAAIREPASITGDGRHTLMELIAIENAKPERGQAYQSLLTTIDHEAASRFLGAKKDDVPAKGKKVVVLGVANVGKGGLAIDVTDTVDSTIVATAQKLVDHLDMGLCGIDFLVSSNGEAYLIEANVGPSLGLHEYPYQGKKRGTPDKFLDWLTK